MMWRNNMRIMRDGNLWCLIKGCNLQVGKAAFGNTPYLAYLEYIEKYPEDKSSEALRIIKANLSNLNDMIASIEVVE
jgi:hypothetical protein